MSFVVLGERETNTEEYFNYELMLEPSATS